MIDDLVDADIGVARALARRYHQPGIELGDLERVAFLALTDAAHRWDPTAGNFLAYAVSTIGEELRHCRDSEWTTATHKAC